MLTNPYPNTINSGSDYDSGMKFQCDVHPGDKALLMSLRPSKGTLQLIVNNLLKNLCDDIRELNITGWQLDGDQILTILVERRELSEGQRERLRHTSICTVGTVPPRILDYRGGTSIRKKASKLTSKATNTPKRTPRRVERIRETISPQTTTQSEQNTAES
jgi:hypothetical protein